MRFTPAQLVAYASDNETLYPGDLLIVAARPSMGKTALVLDMAIRVARQNLGAIAVFSLEMSSIQLVRRMVSMISGVTSGVLKSPSISVEQYPS